MTDRPKTKTAALAEIRELIDRFSTGEVWSDEARERLSAITNTDLKYVVKKENPEFPSDNRHIHVSHTTGRLRRSGRGGRQLTRRMRRI